ncbi:MAG: hypothetical protein ACI8RZ_003800 [Myxococcota bacterium]|jgi:hypothetical protein
MSLPDGTDPSILEHTMAREFLAGYALKTATTIPGIPVQPFTNNRCAESDWADLGDGRSWCETPGAWDMAGWDDAFITWWSDPDWYAFPMTTLISTGMPDASIPGALAPQVLGSTTLADLEWEGCAWPETFAPDVLGMYDPTSYGSSEPYATFDGETYRFGRDDRLDVVMALATNQRRHFCPTGLAGLTPAVPQPHSSKALTMRLRPAKTGRESKRPDSLIRANTAPLRRRM